MRKFPLVLALLCFGLSLAPGARAQDRLEFFGGFSYLRPSITLDLNSTNVCPVGEVPPCPPVAVPTDTHPNMKGWEFSAGYKLRESITGVADFSGYYSNYQGALAHEQLYLFGPQIRLQRRVAPYAHVLLGVAHQSLAVKSSPGFTNPGTDKAFAAEGGVGIDINMGTRFAFRVIELDYVVTRFGGATQSQPRASAGIVLRF